MIVVTHRARREELAEHSPDATVAALEPNTIAAAAEELLEG
ncbi:hypothetical protein ACFXPS_30415 [Nocardia sp. NPDC059091]